MFFLFFVKGKISCSPVTSPSPGSLDSSAPQLNPSFFFIHSSLNRRGEEDGASLRESGGRRRRRRRGECEGAQTSVAAAEAARAPSAAPRARRAQERASETKGLLGHRALSQPEEHGPDVRGGHGAPTRAEEVPDVVAVVVPRSSTVRATGGGKLPSSSIPCLLSLILRRPAGGDGRCLRDCRSVSPRIFRS